MPLATKRTTLYVRLTYHTHQSAIQGPTGHWNGNRHYQYALNCYCWLSDDPFTLATPASCYATFYYLLDLFCSSLSAIFLYIFYSNNVKIKSQYKKFLNCQLQHQHAAPSRQPRMPPLPTTVRPLPLSDATHFCLTQRLSTRQQPLEAAVTVSAQCNIACLHLWRAFCRATPQSNSCSLTLTTSWALDLCSRTS